MKFPPVYEAFQMEVPKKESPEEKEARIIEEFGVDSRKAYSYLVEACMNSPVAMGIVLNHAATRLIVLGEYIIETVDGAFYFTRVYAATKFNWGV